MDNNMKGALFHNDKQGNENRPDLRGEVTIGGVKYSVSGWNNTSKGGKDYVGLQVSEWKEQAAPQAQAPTPAQGGVDDAIPF